MRTLRPGSKAVGKRLDVFIASKYPEYTRSALSRLFDRGLVFVNKSTAKAGAKIRAGDTVKIDEAMLKMEPAKIDLPIIYEDDEVVSINKPAGILTHAKGAINDEPSVASFLRAKITDQNLTGNRAGIVHRLDRGTSGVIVGARTEAAQRFLQKQFSSRRALKTYQAIVEGWPSPEAAIIEAPIERNPKRPQTFRVGAGGKPAQTTYKTLKQFSKSGKNYALLELTPQTGRTHQLRVHLRHIGHPVVGDMVYGAGGENIYLHAASLEITLPSGERRIFRAPSPKIFRDFTKAS